MKLQEVFSQLASGEFSQLSIGGQDKGVVNDKNYATLINHVNLGLTALYARFNLKEGRVQLALQPRQRMYALNSAYAVANTKSKEAVRYIIDSAGAPFIDNILKVERILTDDGTELGLNDGADRYSCHNLDMTTLRVPVELANQTADTPDFLKTTQLTVVFRANHPAIAIGSGLFDPARVNLELPYSHLEALLYFVASRVHNPIGMSNEFHSGNNYAAKYEAACRMLEGEGLKIDSSGEDDRIRRNGWA